MPNWKKVVTSGSSAVLANVTASAGFQGPGSFFVKSDGKVGINNNDPTYKLDVAGNAGINEYLYHNGDTDTFLRFQTNQTDISAGGNALQVTTTKISGSASSTGSFGNVNTDTIRPNGTSFRVRAGDNDFIKVNSTNPIEPTLQFGDIEMLGNSGIFTIDGTNSKYTFTEYNVGIGTTSPSVKLEVVGAISGSAFVAKQKSASMTGANNVDLSTSANHNITITGNITLTPTNFSGRRGQSGIITLIQDSSGGHSITLNSLFKTPRGDSIAFDTTADGISLMSYYVIDASNVAVNYLGPFS